MDRREALKLMGASLAAVAMAGIAPHTHAAILKDRAKNKKRLVFYFTATGNSLFVARQFSDVCLKRKTDGAKKAPSVFDVRGSQFTRKSRSGILRTAGPGS